jgi:hypothetical protein
MNPEEIVSVAIDGLLKGKEVIIPGRLNNFFMLLDRILPAGIKKILMDRTMKRLEVSSKISRYLVPATVPVRASPPKYNFH